MSPLRQKMIDAMRQRGFSIRTHQSYLEAVSSFSRFYKRSLVKAGDDDVAQYFEHLVRERDLSPSTCRVHWGALRFLFEKVLDQPTVMRKVVLPKRAQRLPGLLSATDVRSLVSATDNLKHRSLLCTCYGCGLRVSELVNLRVRDIDGERRVLRIEQGKGNKDRDVDLSEATLGLLRRYWSQYRPTDWLFANDNTHKALSVSTPQKVYIQCKADAGIEKRGGIHSLRHAYATHQLEAGMPIHKLQRSMGHRSLESTMRYVHWVSDYQAGVSTKVDLVGELGLQS
jgi:site-specific recombinase XerD